MADARDTFNLLLGTDPDGGVIEQTNQPCEMEPFDKEFVDPMKAWSVRTAKILKKLKVRSWYGLSRLTAEKILLQRYSGDSVLKEIRNGLARNNLTLRR